MVVVLVVQVVILAAIGGGLKYLETLAGDLKGMLTNPEVRYHLGKVVDPKLVKERRQLFLREGRR